MPSAAPHDFLRIDSARGDLRRADGVRLAALSSEFVQALHGALLDQFTDDAQDVLYRSGYEWGLQDLVRLNRELRAQGGNESSVWRLQPGSVLETWWTPLADAGWGRCSFDVASLGRGVAIVELRDSMVVAALGAADLPVCHLYAGLFAAALSFFERTERHAVEVQCSAMGAAACQFVVAPGPEVDAAETWRQQGVAAAGIIQRLR